MGNQVAKNPSRLQVKEGIMEEDSAADTSANDLVTRRNKSYSSRFKKTYSGHLMPKNLRELNREGLNDQTYNTMFVHSPLDLERSEGLTW